MPTPEISREASRPAKPEAPLDDVLAALPADFWLTGAPPALLWQTVGIGALRIAYARPLPELLS